MSASQFLARVILVAIAVQFAIWSVWAIVSALLITTSSGAP